MGRLASQTATQKLGQVLGLLVIPMLVLWTLYFAREKLEIDRLSRAIVGTELALSVMQTDNVGSNSRLVSQSEQLGDIFRNSGLANDIDSESNQRAETAMLLLPALQKHNHAFAQYVSALSLQTAPQAAGIQKILTENAMAQASLSRLLNILPGETELQAVYKSIDEITSVLMMNANLKLNPSDIQKLTLLQKQLVGFDYEALQTVEIGKLHNRLVERRSELWRNLLLISFAGFISSLAGIGLAVLIMRSTFMQHDTVVLAHAEAQAARKDAEQVALRFTTINNDISNLNQDLASKVKSLNLAQNELMRKNRIEHLGQLTATIAHEIRNPLGAIRTSVFMLERKTSKAGLDTGELIERINNSVNRCDSIISQLHDFAQVKEPNKSVAKLDDWLSKVVREEAKKLPQTIFIECSLGLENLQIAFDPVQLQRAVVNLLNNASEALLNDAQKDGQQKHIWVTTLRSNEYAVIRIADNGPGISAEYLAKVREPLFTTKSFGSGLGLPVVEQIVHLQGGQLDIASNFGSGAQISIRLPLLQQSRAFNAA